MFSAVKDAAVSLDITDAPCIIAWIDPDAIHGVSAALHIADRWALMDMGPFYCDIVDTSFGFRMIAAKLKHAVRRLT